MVCLEPHLLEEEIFICFSVEDADQENTGSGILSLQIVMFKLMKHLYEIIRKHCSTVKLLQPVVIT